MVMMADFRAAHPAEKFLRPIRASAILRIGFFMVDALHFKAGVQLVPVRGVVGIDQRTLGDVSLNERKGLTFGLEHSRDRIAVPLAHDNHGLALAVLVAEQAPIAAMLFQVRGLHIAAEIAAIDFGYLAAAA